MTAFAPLKSKLFVFS
uniref:Uncharacterized protein n=1 Tax=Anguilla anguilla TaxID=7936 RepID=A0A0E9S3E7_ANGAN